MLHIMLLYIYLVSRYHVHIFIQTYAIYTIHKLWMLHQWWRFCWSPRNKNIKLLWGPCSKQVIKIHDIGAGLKITFILIVGHFEGATSFEQTQYKITSQFLPWLQHTLIYKNRRQYYGSKPWANINYGNQYYGSKPWANINYGSTNTTGGLQRICASQQ